VIFYGAKLLDSRLCGNDRGFGIFVIPAEAGIQVHAPDLLRSYGSVLFVMSITKKAVAVPQIMATKSIVSNVPFWK